MYCKIKININSKLIYINAIIDTGNFLREPITKIPVVVVEKNALYNIIPDYILNNLNKIINGEDIDLKEFASKIKIIPFTSLRQRKWNIVGDKSQQYIS